MELFILLFALFVGSVFYMLPTLIAFNIDHKDKLSIALLNFFTGWSFVGWVLSLVWAVKK